MHNAPVELPLARALPPARAGPPLLAPATRAGPPPALCFTGLSLPQPPKTLHKEREPMGLRQRGNDVREKEVAYKQKEKLWKRRRKRVPKKKGPGIERSKR